MPLWENNQWRGGEMSSCYHLLAELIIFPSWSVWLLERVAEKCQKPMGVRSWRFYQESSRDEERVTGFLPKFYYLFFFFFNYTLLGQESKKYYYYINMQC